MNIIEIYRPYDLEPNRSPGWNTGLFVVEYKGKKYQLWSRRAALEKAVELSSAEGAIISDYTPKNLNIDPIYGHNLEWMDDNDEK